MSRHISEQNIWLYDEDEKIVIDNFKNVIVD
jgi:hypothetical protein